MSIVLEAKLKSEPSHRSPLTLDHHCRIDIFLNQRINNSFHHTYHSSLRPQSNRILFASHRHPPRITPSASFRTPDPPRKSVSSFRQVLKHSACRASRARAGEEEEWCGIVRGPTLVPRRASQKGKRVVLMQAPSEFLAIRKQLEKRFERTKLILKEEVKMKKFQKIQQIYEQKYKTLTHQATTSPLTQGPS